MRCLARAVTGLKTLNRSSHFRMASSTSGFPYKMHVTPDNTGLWGIKQTDEAAEKVSELLQEDLEKHHVFFNQDGFHNHIPHHLLALYGTGASPSSLVKAYTTNASYQRPALAPRTAAPPATATFASLTPHLGNEAYYPDFLRFFQSEIAAAASKPSSTTTSRSTSSSSSYQAVLHKYLLAGDAAAEPLLVRLFAGFLHPLIQLMYGMEWAQAAVVAEALAQAAVHSGDIGGFLNGAEDKAAVAKGGRGMAGIMRLVEEVKADGTVAGAARPGDGNKIRDGVMKRASGEMIALAAGVGVGVEEVEERTAEMFETCVLMAAAAALVQPTKQPKFDFFLMHHVTSAPFFVTLNAQDWVSPETKARLLEWKIRMDLLQYAARGVPELSLEKLAAYQPRRPELGGSLEAIVARLHDFPDDGHAIKLGRAAVICRNVCKKYEDQGRDWVKIKGDDMWAKVCHLIVDSVEAPGARWVRSCGFEEAWEDIPDIEDPRL
ncbi:hypothetical protein BT67DRAFT_413207 [Trichocladium antarcticum]|uniref:HypA protein n=1 Tax=Trichocladium antarcticum TaxID=1450529 RepID=A0AAN6UT01_9PEZI|nr:hypothetical protein BT67DRAFT_413207 [Trichocladium antarcticum]